MQEQQQQQQQQTFHSLQNQIPTFLQFEQPAPRFALVDAADKKRERFRNEAELLRRRRDTEGGNSSCISRRHNQPKRLT